jgi:undecaprenyl-diphosphatase
MFAFDKPVFDWLYGLAGRFWLFDFLIVFLANWLIYFAIIFFGIAILRSKSLKTQAYFLSLAALGAIISRGILAEIIRYINYNPRPFEELGIKPLFSQYATASFPSGHVSFFFPIALAAYSYNKKMGTWLIVATILMGIARVISGVHWFSDIIAGLVVGFVGFWAAKTLLPKLAVKK